MGNVPLVHLLLHLALQLATNMIYATLAFMIVARCTKSGIPGTAKVLGMLYTAAYGCI